MSPKRSIKQLRQRVFDVRTRGKDKLAKYQALEAKADRTDEENAELTKLDGELAALTAELQSGELDLTRAQQEEERMALLTVTHDPRLGPRVPGVNARSYAGMFGTPPIAGISANEWLHAVHTGLWRPGIQAAAMIGSTGSDGGFAVPQEFVAQMLDLSLENEIVRPRARIEPMTSDTKKAAGFDNTDHTTNIGGFKVVWPGEAQPLAAQKGILRAIELKARKAAILVEASNELLADGGQTFEALLNNQLSQGLGWGMDDAFLNGVGGGQPLGVLNDPAIIVITKEAGQVADTIVYENLVKMFSRLHPALVRDSVWVCNTSCLPQLLTLQQKIKNVAGTENVGGSWVPVVREDGSGNMTLLTRPLITTEKLPVLGDAGDIILVNFSQYVIGLRNDMSLAKSGHAGFESDTSFYRIIARVDGMGGWKGAMTPKKGATLSWVVKLEERA